MDFLPSANVLVERLRYRGPSLELARDASRTLWLVARARSESLSPAGADSGPGVNTVDGFDLSASAGYTVSNATNLSQLRGKFDFATTGEQIVGGTSLTVFWNSSHTVYGVTFGIAAGGGVYGGFGTTNTGVFMFKGWSSTLQRESRTRCFRLAFRRRRRSF